MVSPDRAETNRQITRQEVGEVRRGMFARLRYLAAVIYWSIRHRSVSRGRWVAAYETHTPT